MKKQTIEWILLIIPFILLSCMEKTHFTEEDLAWVNVYNKGDTLIFQETISLKKDTTYIIKKEIFHGGFQPMSTDKFEHIARLWYRNNNLRSTFKDYVQEEKMVTMYKRDANKPAKLRISYLGYSYHVKNYRNYEIENVSLSLGNRVFEDVYVFKINQQINGTSRIDTDTQTIYWDKEYGIIRYETYEGTVWERVNW